MTAVAASSPPGDRKTPTDAGPDAAAGAPTRDLLVLGLCLGLAYGLAEAIEFCALGLVPGALSWRSGNSARVLWVAPIFYGLAATSVALVLAAASVGLRRIDWGRILVFVTVGTGAYCGARLQGQLFSPLASLLLAAGLAVQAARLYSRHRVRTLVVARRAFLPLAGVVAVLAVGELGFSVLREHRATANLPPATPGRPNVLVLVADTLRADHVSSYGYARATTPHIDALGREGTLFGNAYSASSWTLPAHASLLTGRPVHEHRAGQEGRPYLDRRYPTLAEVLGKAGYATAGFVANTFWCGRHTGLDRGFAHYADYYRNLGDAVARTVLGRMLAYDVMPHFGVIDIPGRLSAAEMNDQLLDWLDHNGGRPFFAFVNYMDVHGPYLPPPGYRGRFAQRPLEDKVASIDVGAIGADTKVPDEVILQTWRDRYDESLLYLDTEVGHLVEALRDRGLLDNTIVVFTSDHGESWGEHGLLYHGHSLYQDQVRIPLVLRYPAGVTAGVREEHPIGLDGIAHLVTRLAAIEASPFAPPTSAAGATGVRTPNAVSEVFRRRGMPPGWPTAKGGLRSIETDRWHLIVNESGQVELYDVVADPAELVDLAGDAAHAAIRRSLEQQLAEKIPRPGSARKTS